MTTLFKSAEAEATLNRWYEKFAGLLPWPHERREVQTSLGRTGLIVAGPEDALPALCFHGAMAGAPHAMGQLGDLGARRRLIGVDIVGQSVASAQVRPGPEEMGRWVVEVMDALGLERAAFFGVSWGGWVALRGALAAGPRCVGLALLVPAGVVSGPAWPAFRQMGLPALMYALMPTAGWRDRLFDAQFTTPDPMWTAYMGDAMRCMKMDFKVPPLLTDAELASIDAPTMVMAAEHDVSFPGEALLARCAAHLPRLRAQHLIEGSKHVPPFDGRFTPRLNAALEALLDDPEVRARYSAEAAAS